MQKYLAEVFVDDRQILRDEEKRIVASNPSAACGKAMRSALSSKRERGIRHRPSKWVVRIMKVGSLEVSAS